MIGLAYAKRVYHLLRLSCSLPIRNKLCLDGTHIKKNQVHLEWVDNGNLGDTLGPVIYQWMLQKKGISAASQATGTYHLLTCGSLIGVGRFDAVVWGSGAHIFQNIESLLSWKGVRNYDIRAVRGPITRRILLDCGYECPEVFGDPAVLMPLIYDEDGNVKTHDISVVLHYYMKDCSEYQRNDCHYIDIATSDYKTFIREIRASKKIISSSLHGIILAETYGVPAVFLNTGGYVDEALIKYYDWYFSTNRWNVKMAKSLEEAIAMEPLPLPVLDEMRDKLMAAFPFDLWGGVQR